MTREGCVREVGKLYVVGIGPGSIENMTVRAVNVIKSSQIIIGYSKYIDIIRNLVKDKKVFSTGMGGEMERCKRALKLSRDNIVSIVSTGDSGIYGMAGLILELREDEQVEIVPGITASSAAGSVVGAPLMHDNCNISLSDIMTPYELIKKRVELAASGDFVISFYNPKSHGRPRYLKECMDIVRKYRKGSIPVAVVKNALREGQNFKICTIDSFEDDAVDMMSIVIVGNSNSYLKDGIFITPRGYELKDC
jgi:precorrin-3B C17-methyltransferase